MGLALSCPKSSGLSAQVICRTLRVHSAARNAIIVIITGLVAYAVVKLGDGGALTLIEQLPKGLPPVSPPDVTLDRLQVYILD